MENGQGELEPNCDQHSIEKLFGDNALGGQNEELIAACYSQYTTSLGGVNLMCAHLRIVASHAV
jgi:hypothetical protein